MHNVTSRDTIWGIETIHSPVRLPNSTVKCTLIYREKILVKDFNISIWNVISIVSERERRFSIYCRIYNKEESSSLLLCDPPRTHKFSFNSNPERFVIARTCVTFSRFFNGISAYAVFCFILP